MPRYPKKTSACRNPTCHIRPCQSTRPVWRSEWHLCSPSSITIYFDLFEYLDASPWPLWRAIHVHHRVTQFDTNPSTPVSILSSKRRMKLLRGCYFTRVRQTNGNTAIGGGISSLPATYPVCLHDDLRLIALTYLLYRVLLSSLIHNKRCGSNSNQLPPANVGCPR